MLKNRARNIVTSLIFSQLVTLLLFVTLGAFFFESGVAYSCLVGGLIWLLPNFYLAGRLIVIGRSVEPVARVRKIYIGSAIKIAYSGALFVIAIVLLEVDFLVVIGTYLLLTLISGLSLRYLDLGFRS